MTAFTVKFLYVLLHAKGRCGVLRMVFHKACFNIPFRSTIQILVVVLELKKDKFCFFQLYTERLLFCPLGLTSISQVTLAFLQLVFQMGHYGSAEIK